MEYLETVLEVEGLLIGTVSDGRTCYFWEPSRLSSDHLDELLGTLGYEICTSGRLGETSREVYVGELERCELYSILASSTGKATYLGGSAPDMEQETLTSFEPLDWTPPVMGT